MTVSIQRKDARVTKFSQLKPGDIFGIPKDSDFLGIVTEPKERTSHHNTVVIANGNEPNDVLAGCFTSFQSDAPVELMESMSVVLIK